MSLMVTKPGTLEEPVAREIEVRGACGHTWTAKTTKAALIEFGLPDKWDRSRVRLYCRDCYREGKPRQNLTPVVAVNPPAAIRYCASGHHRVRLRRDNHGDYCGACERAHRERRTAEILERAAG